MKEVFLLADENIAKLGLGDLINRFSSLKNAKNSKMVLLFRNLSSKSLVLDLEEILYDIVKNKSLDIQINDQLNYSKISAVISSSELKPKLKTRLVFSKDELDWAKKVLEECGFRKNDKLLAICNNISGKNKKKMWSAGQWLDLIEKVIKKDQSFAIVLLANFRDLRESSDDKIIKSLVKKYPKIKLFSFQKWIKNNLQIIIEAQKVFGKSKNNAGFSIRQFGAIFFELFRNKKSYAVFNDTGLAHLAVAAFGKNNLERIISLNVENTNCYGLRNGGKSFPFEKNGKKTEPSKVARYILSIKN